MKLKDKDENYSVKKKSIGAKIKPDSRKIKQSKTVRGLYVCEHCTCCESKYVSPENKHTIFRSRDLNAAKNILNVTQSELLLRRRPIGLCCGFSLSERIFG